MEYLITFIISLILGSYLYKARKRIKQLETERLGLIEECKRLEEKLRKYTGVKTKIALTLPEKRIALSSLEDSAFKDKITTPKTKRFIRIIYNTLRGKVKDSIREEYAG